MYEFREGLSYKSKNTDGTYFYYKVLVIMKDYIRLYMYRDDDKCPSRFDSKTEYTMARSRVFFRFNWVTKLTDGELLALML